MKRCIAAAFLITAALLYGQTHFFVGDLFEGWFTEPVECAYIVLTDGTVFKITSYHAHGVAVFLDNIREKLGKRNKTFADVMFIIHNHTERMVFSPTDIRTYWRLKRKGFRGFFLLRQPTGKVIEYSREAK